MSLTMRSVLKDAGAAFAVLALYMLTLLVPLHQSAASQRAFTELGYEAFGAWSICTAIAESGSDIDGSGTVGCPLTGVGKQTAGLVSIPALIVPMAVIEVASTHWAQALPAHSVLLSADPRAPPVQA